jgi:hypothetical protein
LKHKEAEETGKLERANAETVGFILARGSLNNREQAFCVLESAENNMQRGQICENTPFNKTALGLAHSQNIILSLLGKNAW